MSDVDSSSEDSVRIPRDTFWRGFLLLVGVIAGGGVGSLSGGPGKDALQAMESKLVAIMAEDRAARALEAAEQSKLIATFMVKSDSDRQVIRELKADLKDLEDRTGSRFTREDGSKQKTEQAAVDRSQDDRVKELEARLREHESLPWHPRAGATAADTDRRLTATEGRLSAVEAKQPR